MRNFPIPDPYFDAWHETGAELAEASEELRIANERYHAALTARLALRKVIEDYYVEPRN